jgi:hypothetical protein
MDSLGLFVLILSIASIVQLLIMSLLISVGVLAQLLRLKKEFAQLQANTPSRVPDLSK